MPYVIFSRMEYFVIGADGQEYGPAKVDALRDWAQQNRILPTTILKDALSGERLAAAAVPGIFPPNTPPPSQNWSQPPAVSNYPRGGSQYTPPTASNQDGLGYLGWAIGRSVLALILFFVLHGIGLIVAGVGLANAFQSKQSGHRYGTASLVISVVTFVVIGIGWLIRLSSHT